MTELCKPFDEKMRKTIEVVKGDFASVRAGRANAGVLDRIQVEYYGTPTPIQQVASNSTPDPRTLANQPWDASILKAIEEIRAFIQIGQPYLEALLKMIGITYVAEFAAGMCRDAGYGSLGSQIEIFGKLSILALSMPILLALFGTLEQFLQ